MRVHKDDVVSARRTIQNMDRPRVPKGTKGTVLETTVFGRPKRVCFAVSDVWGPKRIRVSVGRHDVDSD
jgi:hypothetical protein